LAPTGVAFDPTFIGTRSQMRPVLLYNPQSTPLTISTIAVTGPYQIMATNCGATLAAFRNCKINIAYFPTREGSERGELDVTASLAVTPVPLWGVGTNVRVTPVSLSFADQGVGVQSAPLTLQLRNAQTHTLILNQIVATGDYAIDPSTTCATGAGKLKANKTCNIAVTFTPTATGARNGTITVHTGTNVDPVTIPLSGNGVPF
jgi:hypothetical protein